MASPKAPTFTLDEEAFNTSGFTLSGKTRFEATLTEYKDELFVKSISLGDADRAKGHEREVTHDHVRSAAARIANIGQLKQSNWWLAGHIGEYVLLLLVGIFTSRLDKPWGIAAFILSAAVGILLVTARLVKGGDR